MIRATMSLRMLALTPEKTLFQHSVPVETQDFGENEDKNHANKDPRLAHERAHALYIKSIATRAQS